MISENKKSYRQWVVMIGCCVIMFYGQGLASNLFSAFVTPIAEHLGLSVAQMSSVSSMIMIAPLVSIIVANYVYKCGYIRSFTYIFCILMGVGYILLARAQSLMFCYLAAMFIGFGFGAGVIIPISILLTKWFDKNRGLAFGIVTASSGMANTIMSPITNSLLKHFGLTNTLYFHGVTIIALGSLAIFMIKDRKEDLQENRNSEEIVNIKDLLKTRKYWCLAVGAVVVGGTLMTVINQFPSFLIANGYSRTFSAMLFSLFGIFMIIGKIVYGKIIDWLGSRRSTIYIYVFWFLGIASTLFVGKFEVMPYVFVVLIGLGSPIGTMALPIWTSDFFDGKNYSTAFSSITFIQYIGISLCLFIMGLLTDMTGSYTSGFVFFLVIIVYAFLVIMSCYRSKPKTFRK